MTWALANDTVIPRPIAAGVFGIARTTAAPFGRCFSKEATERPAAMESVSVSGPARRANGGNTVSITCGLTAARSTAGGFGSAVTIRLYANGVLGGELLDVIRRRRLLDDDVAAREAALQEALEQSPAHLAGAGENEGAFE